MTNRSINNIKEFETIGCKEAAMATTFTEALRRKGGGDGARAMLRHLKAKLSSADFDKFLDGTPDGEDFWPAYMNKKLASNDPGAYDADKYAKYILQQRN